MLSLHNTRKKLKQHVTSPESIPNHDSGKYGSPINFQVFALSLLSGFYRQPEVKTFRDLRESKTSKIPDE